MISWVKEYYRGPCQKLTKLILFIERFSMSEYHIVASTAELGEEDQIHVNVNGIDILLCKHAGKYYAIDYYCNHAFLPMEGGSMEHGLITCPYHGAEFSLADGSAQAAPAWEALTSYPVQVNNESITIAIT